MKNIIKKLFHRGGDDLDKSREDMIFTHNCAARMRHGLWTSRINTIYDGIR